MKRLLVVSALAAAFTVSVLPAIADPASDALKAKLASAWQGVKSFKFSTQPLAGSDAASSLGNATITTTMVLPDKMEVAFEMNGMSMKVVALSSETWKQMNGGAWLKMPSGGMIQQTDAKKYIDQGVVKTLPDEDFNGKKVGAFTASSAASEQVGISVCNYDKTSYLLMRCHNTVGSVLFSDFNSPTNVIDVPK
jgi:hypothetical protein